MRSVAVYSTFCGVTEKATFSRQKIDDRYPHIFLSNNEDVLKAASEDGWRPVYLDFTVSSDPVTSAMQAKVAKAVPHKIPDLEEYDFVFYKDDKVQINTDLIDVSIDQMLETNSSYSIWKHPYHSRGNVILEFGESMFQPRYASQLIQTADYIVDQVNLGYPLVKDIFFATTKILRNQRHPETNSINEMWYDHILKCGIECQISFHFVSQRFYSITTLPEGIRIW